MAIKKRHVFYVPGYEPDGPSFYEKLFLRHLSRYTRISGLSVKSSERSNENIFHRTIAQFTQSDSCESLTYDILDNEQILKSHSNIARWKFYLILIYLTPKAFWAALRPSSLNVRYGPLTLFFPWFTFYAAVFLIWLIGLALTSLLSLFSSSTVVIYSIIILVSAALFYLFDYAHQRYNISRMFHCGRFFGHGGDPIQEKMSRRLDEFNEHIVSNILLNEADEYVILGHSLGSALATRMTAKLIQDERIKSPLKDRKIHLICMGSVYQLEQGGQTHFDSRTEVYRPIRDCKELSWSEVYAAFDPFCPHPMNPCDERLEPDTNSPKKPFFRSANFKKNLSHTKLNRLRRNFFWIHMQYMLSSDTAETFDYFKLITGKISVTDYLQNPR